jgi:hypothetical protein
MLRLTSYFFSVNNTATNVMKYFFHKSYNVFSFSLKNLSKVSSQFGASKAKTRPLGNVFSLMGEQRPRGSVKMSFNEPRGLNNQDIAVFCIGQPHQRERVEASQ